MIATYPGKDVYGGVYLAATNGVLNEAVVNYTILAPYLAPDCWMLAQRFVCGFAFPACNQYGNGFLLFFFLLVLAFG